MLFLLITSCFSDAQFIQNVVSVRFQSTSIHTAIQNSDKTKKKKIRRSKKKYAELVEGKNKLMPFIIICVLPHYILNYEYYILPLIM
jgi:hypothetical protein